MHRSFKLHHRRHTGKLIHHRHTSYLALVIVLVSAGLCLALTDSQARATDLAVTATVPAPIPSGAPVFTLPSNNSMVENPVVHFEGICPVIDPAVIITLYDGTDMIGSTACQADGTFALNASIYEGARSIVAKVVTITGDFGQSSAPLSITYKPPVPPVVPSPGTPSTPPITKSQPKPASSPDIAPLNILSDQRYISFGLHAMGAWRGSFIGGNTPYTVTFDWGDGTIQNFKDINRESQTYIHAYKDQRQYDAAVTVTDKDGRTLTRHYAAVSFASDKAATTAVTNNILPSNDSTSHYVYYLSYSALLVATLWLWRFEFLHHRKVVGVALHYGWQKNNSARPTKSRRL